MHIVVIGGGNLGRELTKQLQKKRQKVTVLEKDQKTVNELQKELDISAVQGDGTDSDDLKKVKVQDAELLIAVTGDDAGNLLSCMIAKKVGVPLTVARLSDPIKVGKRDQYSLTKDQLGIDYIINIKKSVAREITELVHFPYAKDIEFFAHGKITVLGVRITSDCKKIDTRVDELSLPDQCQVIGIKKAHEKFQFNSKEVKLAAGDIIYLIGSLDQLKGISETLTNQNVKNKRILILGGKGTGYQLVKQLEAKTDHHNFTIKVIEKDRDFCDQLKRELKHSIILAGDYYNEEEISEAHVVISVTGDDRSNIITTALAEKQGINTITEIKDVHFEAVYNALEIDSTVNPYLTTCSQIMRLSREEDVLSLNYLQHGEIVVTELKVPKSSSLINEKIQDLSMPNDVVVGALDKGGEDIFIPCYNKFVESGDKLIVCSSPNSNAQKFIGKLTQ